MIYRRGVNVILIFFLSSLLPNLFISFIFFISSGGPWKLPVCRPACLRPMLRRAEYKEFAEKVNKRLEWQPYGIEMMTFYTVAFVAPPLAAFLMVR